MTTNRTDTHRPSLLDPSEYEFLGCFYKGSSDAMHKSYATDHRELAREMARVEANGGSEWTGGNYSAKETCDHCGAVFAHGVVFLHVPTNQHISVGHICASETIGLPSRAAAAKRSAEKAAAEEKARLARHEANAEWQAANTDIIAYLETVKQDEEAWRTWNEEHPEAGHPRDNGPRKNPNRAPHAFLLDMVHTFNRWGNLSEKQAAATRKFMAAAKERAENPTPVEPEPTTPLEDGRREITGIVVHTKWSEDRGYGSQPKMVVKQADGNKVFGTVPEAAFTAERASLDQLKGMEVSFKATVERSNDDEHFGFYKRPTNLTVKEVTA